MLLSYDWFNRFFLSVGWKFKGFYDATAYIYLICWNYCASTSFMFFIEREDLGWFIDCMIFIGLCLVVEGIWLKELLQPVYSAWAEAREL